jgi:hypothetical protein
MTNQIQAVLDHANWTGLTLRDLVDAGRILADDTKAIWEFTKAALGEPVSIQQFKEFQIVAKEVSSILA